MSKRFETAVTKLFNIDIPIIQGGMIWASGWRLASAVSNAGGLGLLGSGSMYPEVLKEHIQKCKAATNKPFGVNLPLLYPSIEEHIKTIISEGVKIVFTSAGNPTLWTSKLQAEGIKVVHVVSSVKFAKKVEHAGCDAVVAEGFEAGGHNGREETTTMVLTPAVCDAVSIPVIAAGGIATGKQFLAAMALGAAGVQIGSRFVCSEEASSHQNFKQKVLDAKEGDTFLRLKKIAPTRLLKNNFYDAVQAAEDNCADENTLKNILSIGKAKLGMFEGDTENGELEIGQVSMQIDKILPVERIIEEIQAEYFNQYQKLGNI